MTWKTISSIFFIASVFVYYLYRIRKVQQNPDSVYNKKITKFGLLIFAIMTVVIIGILSLEFIAPNSEISKLVSTEAGFFILLGVAIVFAIISRFLRKFGLKVLQNKKEDIQHGHRTNWG